MHRFVVTGMTAAFCFMVGVNAYGKGKTAAVPPEEKDMAPSAVAGVYTRKIAQQPGTLTIKAAGPNKIDVKFDCALEGLRHGKGTAHGVVKLKKDFAVLDGKTKRGEYSISMRFGEGQVIVLYNGDGFGEIGVDPQGVYRKK